MDPGVLYHVDELSGDEGSPHPTNYAFLNHSTATLPNNLPPNVDDKPLARQKRKRTSPEDQAVLEAAYKRDAKPDKAARIEIVKQVALGEKEVQIWFQNRRQSSRRKSRPLLPHEIAQYQMTRSGIAPHEHFSDSPALHGSDETIDSSGEGQQSSRRPSIDVARPPSSQSPANPGQYAITGPPGSVEAPLHYPPVAPSHTHPSAIPPPSSSQSSLPEKRPIYLANRRSAPPLRLSQEQTELPSEPAPVQADTSERRLRKSSSFVRLSMTSEGAAKIVTKDTTSPSPPRASQASQQSFASSQGAAISPPNFRQSNGDLTVTGLKRSASGRSRDSRAWEFWCDKESRTELEDKAEKDGSGSAADAIGLMRANSGRRPLSSVPAKRNALLTRQPLPSKRMRLEEKRPTLQRSNTSSGRLQQASPRGKGLTPALKRTPKLHFSGSAASLHLPGNDSDKENWSPEHDIYSASQPAMGISAATPAKTGLLRGQSSNATVSARSPVRTPRGALTADPEADPEVAAFMRSQRKSNSVSEDEELDCVHGLLSLSQGNWR